MLNFSHSLIGASIAKLVPNPYIGLPLSLLSHVLGDYVPHWDFNTRESKRPKLALIALSLTDAFIGFSLGYLIFRSSVNPTYLFAMMFTAQLPDWLEAPYHVFDWKFFPFSYIKHFQSVHHNKLNLPWGLIIQILVTTLVVILSLHTQSF
jgi:hypothetical protein